MSQETKTQQPYTVTFKVTRLEDGRIQGEYKVVHTYKDEMGTQGLDMNYSGTIIWDKGELDINEADFNREKLERGFCNHARRDFESVPRPLTARVVYEIDGVEPAEKRFTINEYIPEDEDEF